MKNKLKNILALFILIFAFVGCSSSDDAPTSNSNLNAAFVIEQNEDDLLVNQSINFSNTSAVGNAQPINYLWDFGDGQTSNLQNPSHTYNELGNYIVKLTINSGSETDIFSKELVISLSNSISGRATLLEKLANNNNKIMICAHRGSHETAPENSLASITEAINNNIGMVELDVRQTKDGVLVLMHDATINRTTNGTGTLSNMTYQELLQFYLKKPDGTLTTERIPTLEQVLELSRGQVYINIDVDDQKSPPIKVYKMVKQYGMVNQVMFFSSFYADINSLHLQNSSVIAMPTIYNQNDFNSYSNSNLNIKVVHFNDNSLNANLVNQAKAKGWFIFENAYINTNASPNSDSYLQINTFINLGGDIVQTDYTTLIKNHLISLNLY